MTHAVTAARTVLILGQDADPGAIGFVERAARLEGEVVLLSLGYPISEPQQALVATALALVAETHSGLDVVLVPDAADLPRYLVPEDRVAVFASGMERRTIERVVRAGVGRASAESDVAGR